MRIHTHASRVLAGALALVCIGQAALADWVYTPGKGISYEYAEGKKLTLGADVRVRLTNVDRNVIWPEGPPTVGLQGPDLQWLRVRTRIKLGLDLWENAKLSARFVNRSHNVSSHFLDPNDQPGNWQYPDEIIADQLALTLSNLAGVEGMSLTLGRQDLILGNGMVFLEGTPYDQGRTIYFDGATLRYKNSCDSLILFAFYNDAQDPIALVGDEDRDLRRGDIFTTGIDWTHTFNPSFNTELYYIYALVDDEMVTAREHSSNTDARIHTAGARVFGSPSETWDYSIEVARQFSEYAENPSLMSPTDGKADGEGWMVDARLTMKAPEWATKPSLMFEYTYLSGDDPDTGDYEGWDGLFAEYPIWGEELLPIMNNGAWNNLHQYRLELKMALAQNLKFTAAYAHLRADENDVAMGTTQGGCGGHFGDLYSAFLDYTINEYVTISLQAAVFDPGNYWASSNDNSEWLRIQTVFSF